MSVFEMLAYHGPAITTDRLIVEPFTITRGEADLAAVTHHGGRGPRPGDYWKLLIDGKLWMSDTAAERRDHTAPVSEAIRREGDCLVHGLGLGLVVHAMMQAGRNVDVVEIDGDVIDAVSPYLLAAADTMGVECRVHQGDAYTFKLPKGQTWAVAWHDIWANLSVDNLDGMATLHRRYGRRTEWQGSWGKTFLRMQRDRDRRSGWY